MKMMIVDDNYFCRNAIIRLLTQYISEYIECKNGAEALEKLRNTNEEISFVIVDYQMPGMNGIELIKKIRQYETGTKQRTILCICYK